MSSPAPNPAPGGTHPAQAPIPFVQLDSAYPELFEQLMDAVRDVASRSAFTLGDAVEGFEEDFARFCGAPHAVGVSSGTEALVLALRALEVGPGDEVLVPANSFIATAEAVTLVGATPRFVDVDPATGLITPESIAAALNPKVRCVIPVHLYGATVDMEAVTCARARGGDRGRGGRVSGTRREHRHRSCRRCR